MSDKVREALEKIKANYLKFCATYQTEWLDEIAKLVDEALSSDPWQPIETKPPFTPCYEKGEYRTNDDSLYYFKPTHWQPLPAPPENK